MKKKTTAGVLTHIRHRTQVSRRIMRTSAKTKKTTTFSVAHRRQRANVRKDSKTMTRLTDKLYATLPKRI